MFLKTAYMLFLTSYSGFMLQPNQITLILIITNYHDQFKLRYAIIRLFDEN